MMKASPVADGERRYVYFEASNEGLDQQGEVVASQALAKSADYYKRYGNIDIDHISLIGAKSGVEDYPFYEIGLPVDVGQRDGSTFVKGELYRGAGPAAKRANQVWAGLTEIQPAQRWYPSVGGAVLGKSTEVNDRGERGRTLVTNVRWSNVALSRTPVNQHVGLCSAMPVGVFAKCMGAGGLDIAAASDMSKALTAGYGTDSASLTGGSALRMQSVDTGGARPRSYFDFRDRLAGAVRRGDAGKRPSAASLHSYATQTLGLPEDQAAEWVERFMRDAKAHLERKAA